MSQYFEFYHWIPVCIHLLQFFIHLFCIHLLYSYVEICIHLLQYSSEEEEEDLDTALMNINKKKKVCALYITLKCTLGWMDDLRFYVLFNSISVTSGRLVDDNERLCAMEPCLQLRRFHLEWGSNLGPLDQ